jgi:hypothetical protein
VDECKPLDPGVGPGWTDVHPTVLAVLLPQHAGHHLRGMAVQVDPIKPTLKAPETKRLKLKCHYLRLNLAFKFKLRRYNVVDSSDVERVSTSRQEFHAILDEEELRGRAKPTPTTLNPDPKP